MIVPYQQVPAEYLRFFRTLHLTLGSAVIPISIVIPVVAGVAPPSADDYSTIDVLTQLHLIVFVASFFAPRFFVPKITKDSKQKLHVARPEERDAAWTQWLEATKSAHILALSFREGPAMFGLVTLLLASMNGVLWENSYYWANYLSTVLFIVYLYQTYPNADSIIASSRN